MKILSIAGARPNFMKLASIARAVEKYNQNVGDGNEDQRIRHVIVHTGQHYDEKMSRQFFVELNIPKPDINLEVGSGSHAGQTAEIMKRFEQVLLSEKPDFLLVVGDVNSTVACSLVASKIQYPDGGRPVIVHVEAGLRSFDRAMPEEINRLVTDVLSDLLFVTEASGVIHLRQAGVAEEKIHFVGNVMIDTLISHLAKAKLSAIRERLAIRGPYGLVTLHRPSNVDSREALVALVNTLRAAAEKIPLVFPVHPRTANNLVRYELREELLAGNRIRLTEPLGYLDFLNLLTGATMILTDSGGIQEETTYLKVPCITLRDSTERPITVTEGSNYLVGTESRKILETVEAILAGQGKRSRIPEFWDGKAGDRIVSVLGRMHAEAASAKRSGKAEAKITLAK